MQPHSETNQPIIVGPVVTWYCAKAMKKKVGMAKDSGLKSNPNGIRIIVVPLEGTGFPGTNNFTSPFGTETSRSIGVDLSF